MPREASTGSIGRPVQIVADEPDVCCGTLLLRTTDCVQGMVPFLESMMGDAKLFCVLQGKVMLGSAGDIVLSGPDIRREHCRITSMGLRLLVTPLDEVSLSCRV